MMISVFSLDLVKGRLRLFRVSGIGPDHRNYTLQMRQPYHASEPPLYYHDARLQSLRAITTDTTLKSQAMCISALECLHRLTHQPFRTSRIDMSPR
jgi:hypothetical protein